MALYMEGVSSSSGSTGESFSTVVSRFTCHINCLFSLKGSSHENVSLSMMVQHRRQQVHLHHTTQVTLLKEPVSRECFVFADGFLNISLPCFVRNTYKHKLGFHSKRDQPLKHPISCSLTNL